MRDYRDDNAIREVWQVGERILVCIGPNALAERLIRAGKRFATSLRAEWIVVYVETPRLQQLPPDDRDRVLRMLRLAEQLGAEAVTLAAADMVEAILEFAQERNVTKLMMGKPTRRGWTRWLLGSVVDTIIGHAHNINVYLLGSPRDEDEPGQSAEHRPPFSLTTLPDAPRRGRYRGYLWAGLVTLLCTAIARGMFGQFDLANLVMVYLLGVIFVATRFGRGPSILSSVLGVAALDWLFVTPYFSFSVSDTEYLITLLAMLAVAIVISHLMASVRYQARVAGHRERRATVLYTMSKELAVSRSETEVMSVAVQHIHAEFGCPNVILFPDDAGRIVHPDERALAESLPAADLGVAQWVYDHNEVAGHGTNTLAGAEAVYYPLTSTEGVIGVWVLKPSNLRRLFLPEQKRLLETAMGQVAQALERVRLAEQARVTSVEIETERLRNSLLSAISHDLRTPLATIVGSASTLAESDGTLSEADRMELSQAIFDEARRMSNLVNNILDMARLDSGAVELNREWQPLEEIIGTVLRRLQPLLASRPVQVKLAEALPLIHVDGVMIEQVIVNLLENAVRYSPEGSGIEIGAEVSPFTVTISVADRGPGIPKGLEDRLFEKFYRVHRESAQSGVGLGLAICRAIVEAHGGTIQASNRGSGGAVFWFMLPLGKAPPTIEPNTDGLAA
jgi:two-component system sensor histidine kinase KdpD